MRTEQQMVTGRVRQIELQRMQMRSYEDLGSELSLGNLRTMEGGRRRPRRMRTIEGLAEACR